MRLDNCNVLAFRSATGHAVRRFARDWSLARQMPARRPQ
jgi:hypothetical protein